MDKFELLETLRHLDEVTLLELLEVCSDDIVDRFLDRIEEKEDVLYEKAREA